MSGVILKYALIVFVASAIFIGYTNLLLCYREIAKYKTARSASALLPTDKKPQRITEGAVFWLMNQRKYTIPKKFNLKIFKQIQNKR